MRVNGEMTGVKNVLSRTKVLRNLGCFVLLNFFVSFLNTNNIFLKFLLILERKKKKGEKKIVVEKLSS